MGKIEKLLSTARKKAEQREKQADAAVYDKMTIDQLRELAYGNPSDERIREIFASVGGLHLLERE